MAVYKQLGSKNWWYQFVWDGKRIRESTRQTVKRVAEQMEAAHKARLAKGEVGIREKKPIPTFEEFATADFLPFIEARFLNKAKTLEYYRNGVKSLSAFIPIGSAPIDSISTGNVTGFISKRRKAGLKVSSINRELEVLRRMLRLAFEWGILERSPLRVQMLPGENQRDRVLTSDDESRYYKATIEIGDSILVAYARVWTGFEQDVANRLRSLTTRFNCEMSQRYCWIADCARRNPSDYVGSMCGMVLSTFRLEKPRTHAGGFL